MVKDKKASEFATRDYTIHLSKRLYGVTFKKRAPRAVREVKKFAQQMMKTRCVGDVDLAFPRCSANERPEGIACDYISPGAL